jgi:hypothetical protein
MSNKTDHTSHHAPMGQAKLLAFVHAMLGGSAGREDDEHPLPPGPWDPVIRRALEKMQPALRVGHSLGDEVALNPQPLPPRYAFLVSLARTLVGRAELMQEIADATVRKGEQLGIIIVSGYVSRFSDEFCGNDFRFRWPFPGPRPNWFAERLDAIDLVVMATQFDAAAKQAHQPDLRRSLAGAGSRFAEMGMARLA